MKLLVTGGAGYVGSRLVPRLLGCGYEVTVYDTLFFGSHLPSGRNVEVIEGDIRDTDKLRWYMDGCDQVLHLACISNDAGFELDESLSRTMNYECFEPMVVSAKEVGVKRFIYCSTSSVYGISDAPDVREDHPLVPLTLYNTYKGKCEPLLFKHTSKQFEGVVVRPSTICGYSPRMRFDLSANIMANLAIQKREMTVYGGAQMRPNLHIEDMCDVYETLVKSPSERVANQIYNAGHRNMSIMEIAQAAQKVVSEEFGYTPEIKVIDQVTDNRSYQINSDKIRQELPYYPQRSVEEGIRDVCRAFKRGEFKDSLENDVYYNVKMMRQIWTDVYKDAPPLKVDPLKGQTGEIDYLREKSATA